MMTIDITDMFPLAIFLLIHRLYRKTGKTQQSLVPKTENLKFVQFIWSNFDSKNIHLLKYIYIFLSEISLTLVE